MGDLGASPFPISAHTRETVDLKNKQGGTYWCVFRMFLQHRCLPRGPQLTPVLQELKQELKAASSGIGPWLGLGNRKFRVGWIPVKD